VKRLDSDDVRDGSTVTFEEYARSELPALLRTATAISGDPHLAEEIVQDVLVKIARHWATIEGTENRRAYVRRMIVNELVSWRRKWARLIPTDRLPEPEPERDIAERTVDRDLLRSELGRLPMRQQAVLALRYFEGLDDAAIADALSCAPATVRSLASRGLQRLRVQVTVPPGQPRAKEDLRAH
jgi:RNA polymerase sigma-70 factor (sigma-E family)